jgi:hypothetical protein
MLCLFVSRPKEKQNVKEFTISIAILVTMICRRDAKCKRCREVNWSLQGDEFTLNVTRNSISQSMRMRIEIQNLAAQPAFIEYHVN